MLKHHWMSEHGAHTKTFIRILYLNIIPIHENTIDNTTTTTMENTKFLKCVSIVLFMTMRKHEQQFVCLETEH